MGWVPWLGGWGMGLGTGRLLDGFETRGGREWVGGLGGEGRERNGGRRGGTVREDWDQAARKKSLQKKKDNR